MEKSACQLVRARAEVVAEVVAEVAAVVVVPFACSLPLVQWELDAVLLRFYTH